MRSPPLIGDIDNNDKDDIILLTCSDQMGHLKIFNHTLDEVKRLTLKSPIDTPAVLQDIDNNHKLDLTIINYHVLNRYEFNQELPTSNMQ